jgi:hypothetical protein
MCFKGIDFVAAATLVSELGDMHRFEHPKQLMAYLGLVPSEYSSGTARTQGSITKTGNTHVRRILVEAAWCYRYSSRMSRPLTQRQIDQPKSVRDIAWRAQLRLCSRYRRLCGRGMHSNKICVAVARELAGFLWEAARHAQPRMRRTPWTFNLLNPTLQEASYRHPGILTRSATRCASTTRRTLVSIMWASTRRSPTIRPRQLRD